ADGKFEVRVKWKGLDEEEASWEPALQLYEDIAVVLRRWIVKNAADGVVKEMRDDLEATLGHSLQGEVFCRVRRSASCALGNDRGETASIWKVENRRMADIEEWLV
ncbi:hypothetical protein AaE_004707, partial [Aphanomyces astaci]